MIYKEIFDAMCTNKSTLFIEGNGAWAVAGANLQDRIPPLIFHGKKVNQGFSISFSVKRWNDSNILDFKDTIFFLCYNAFRFDSVIL